MRYSSIEYFINFMSRQFGIEVDKGEVGEESVLLYKEELDDNLVSKELLEVTPERIMVHTCSYDTEDNEWIVSVASDANTNYPLFLVCLKDGARVYGEKLKFDE